MANSRRGREALGGWTGLLVVAPGCSGLEQVCPQLSQGQRTSPGTSRVSKDSPGLKSSVGTARVLAAPSFRLIRQLLTFPVAFLIFGSCQKLPLFSRRWSKISFQRCSVPLHRLLVPSLGPPGQWHPAVSLCFRIHIQISIFPPLFIPVLP